MFEPAGRRRMGIKHDPSAKAPVLAQLIDRSRLQDRAQKLEGSEA